MKMNFLLIIILFALTFQLHPQTTWHATGGPVGGQISGVYVNNQNDMYVFDGNYYPSLYFIKENGNTDWLRMNFPSKIKNYQFDSTGNIIGLYLGVDSTGTFYKSKDKGISWDSIFILKFNISTLYTNAGFIILNNNDYIIIIGNNYYLKENNSTNLTKILHNGNNLYNLSYDNFHNLYDVHLDSLFKSSDKGITWSFIEYLNDKMYDVTFKTDKNNWIYIFKESTILYSSDTGATWGEFDLTDGYYRAESFLPIDSTHILIEKVNNIDFSNLYNLDII